MTEALDSPVLAEVWRGEVLECVHRGAAVVCRPNGEVVEAWGNARRTILPRSSCKMIQALPLVESGATAALTSRHLALACASHNGAAIHTDLTSRWLADLGLVEDALRCGPQIPSDPEARQKLRAEGQKPSQIYNNCSGKHTGMLALSRHLGSGPEYIDPDHPVQRRIREATAEMASEEPSSFAIDGCSAPNFAITLQGLATQMARMADPTALGQARSSAARELVEAMMTHPDLVAGDGRACTILMRAMAGRAAVKTGADGVFAAILPEQGLGVAVKIDDGSTRGSHAAIAALLSRFGVLDRAHPAFMEYADAPLLNRRGIDCGRLKAADTLFA